MNWLLPGFLAGSLLVGVPIALHFLRSKPKTEVRFPSLRFLGESALRDTRKHRLRRWLTLALRILIILLLAAAFARPFWKDQQAAKQTALIVAVDNSLSMQAGTRWEDLRQKALADLDQLSAGDQAGILQINPAPRWLVPITQDLAGVRAALQEMKPGFETTRYPAALRLAGETLAALPARKKIIVWMADEQRLGWLSAPLDQPLPAGVEIHFGEAVPAPARQAAITSARWIQNAKDGEVEASVRLYSPATAQRQVEVRSGETVLARQTVSLKQGAETKVRLPVALLAGQTVDGLKITITPDDLPADDTAWVAVLPQTAAAVLTEPPPAGTDYLAHALSATRKLNENPLEAAPFPAADWPLGSVAVVQGGSLFTGPRRPHLDRFAKAGGALWIFADGSPEQRQWLEERGVLLAERPAESDPWTLRDWDAENPLLTAFGGEGLFSLMEVEFHQGFDLSGDAVTAVANWPNGTAAIATVNAGGQKFLVCGFPPTREATDWLVQPSFVPFVHQAARWLASVNAAGRNWRVGDTIPLPPGKGTWRVIDSPRPAEPREVSGGVQPEAPGLYEYSDGKSRGVFAVNTPPAESDLAPWPDPAALAALESKNAPDPARAPVLAGLVPSDEASESQQRLWWWLLAICAFGLMAELALANRTAA